MPTAEDIQNLNKLCDKVAEEHLKTTNLPPSSEVKRLLYCVRREGFKISEPTKMTRHKIPVRIVKPKPWDQLSEKGTIRRLLTIQELNEEGLDIRVCCERYLISVQEYMNLMKTYKL